MNKKIFISALMLVTICCSGFFSYSKIAQAESTPTSIIDNTSPSYNEGTYGVSDFIILAIRISKMILGFTGSLALIMFIYGGFMLLISGGSSESVSKGKKIIIAATVGLIIVFSSYLIISFVMKSMGLTWSGGVSIPTTTK